MAAGSAASRSGRADRLPPEHVHDRDQDDRPDQRDDERDDKAGRLTPEEQREQKAPQERADDAKHDVPEDSIAVAAHDLAGEPADDRSHDQKPDELQHLRTSTQDGSRHGELTLLTRLWGLLPVQADLVAGAATVGARGTVKRNSEPAPTTLSTAILPPCISTIWRVMARPSPVPMIFPACLSSYRS